ARRVDESGHSVAEPCEVQAEDDGNRIDDLAERQVEAGGDAIAPAVHADMAAALEREAERQEDQEQAEEAYGLFDPGEAGGESAAKLPRQHLDEIKDDHEEEDRHDGDPLDSPQCNSGLHAAFYNQQPLWATDRKVNGCPQPERRPPEFE